MFHSIINWLNSAVFSIGDTPTSWAEILGFVSGALCVYLVAANNIWTFPVGIANALFFFVLFIDAHFYADAWLQMFFLVIQVFGWWAWLKAGPNRTALEVKNASWKIMLPTAAAGIVFFFIMVPILHKAHGAYPHWDSATTALSVAAQFLLSFKLIQNWYLWIIADLIYIPLYAAKNLYFTSGLYVIFLTICLFGLAHWKQVAKGERKENVVTDSVELRPALVAANA